MQAWRQGLARAWDEAVPARLRRAMPGLFAPALLGRARIDGKVRRVVTQPAADPDTYMNGGRDEFLRAREPRLPAFLLRKLRQAGKDNLPAALNEGLSLIAAAQAAGQLAGFRELGVPEAELLPCPRCRIEAPEARFADLAAAESLVPRKAGCLCAWATSASLVSPRLHN